MVLGRKTIFIGILILSMCMAGSVMAEIKPGAVTISPMVGGLSFDDSLSLDEDDFPNLFSYGLGYNINKNWAVECLLGYAKPTFKTAGFTTTVDTYQYELDALYHFFPDNKLVPYLAGGIGGISYDPDTGDSDTDAQLNVGGGLKLSLNDIFALRADARRMVVFDGDRDYNWSYLLGVTMSFGGEKEIMPEPVPVIVPAPAPALPCTDSDGDGVCDDVDKCPDTPKACPVDSFGCPLDSDSDGVIDCLDKCPDTHKGVTVDERGCWVISAVVLFDLDKAILKPMAREELDKVYDILKKDDLKVEIQGYTCDLGSEEYNQKLSERRAQAVKLFLIEKGIDDARLSTVGYGESNPAVPNTKENRPKNRRVEIKTLD